MVTRSVGAETGASPRLHVNERGAVIFVVIMVLTILTGIGIYAARAAGLNQRLSGYERQATQTTYVAEYATAAAVDEMSTANRNAYYQQMVAGQESCEANSEVDAGVALPCYRIYANELQERVGTTKLFEESSLGHFGEQTLVADFVVEMTDPSPAGRPVAGMDQGGTGPRFTYMQVVMTGSGQVRPISEDADPDAGACSTASEQGSAAVMGTRANRAVVQIGPLPQ